MLRFLQIENIAVIHHAEIDFQNGLSVLTGETGAGKSIIIDAIHAVLGERTSKDFIRTGCDRAEVSAIFSDLDDAFYQYLKSVGYMPEDNGQVLIRRVLSSRSGSSSFLCGSPISAALLRDIGRKLIDIHGQHENQGLLEPERQLFYLDLLADNAALKTHYYEIFHQLNAVRREKTTLENSMHQKQSRMDFLAFQIRELESAQIKVGEYAALKQELALAQNFEKIDSALHRAYEKLCGDTPQESAVEAICSARRALDYVDAFSSQAEKLGDVLCDLETVCADIRDYRAQHEYSEQALAEMRDRQDLLHRLMNKYGGDEALLLQIAAEAKAESAMLSDSDDTLAALQLQLDGLTEQLVDVGGKLTDSRKRAAASFEKRVCAGLRELNMPHVRFGVDFQAGRYTKNGCDTVQFLISANAGEVLKPLTKIASGGELSRVMLVIKSVLADKDDIPTLIFDEVDAGVSGDTASKVGQLLQSVARHRQVLCVTHLPQIAAAAEQHLLIAKSTENGRTFTTVCTLTPEQRPTEIARLMAGGRQTESLLQSACELLDRSKK